MTDNRSNYKHATKNSVAQTEQNGATSSSHDTENVSDTSSERKRRGERITKFEIEFGTKMQLEQARFEQRRLDLEMQMKELKFKRHVMEEEFQLERKMTRTALENDDVRF